MLDLPPASVAALKRIALVLAVIAVVVLVLGRRFGWLDYKPGGAAFDNYISPAFVGLFVVATVVALRWEIVGGAVAGFAAAGMIAFATNQLVPLHAALVVGLLALPGVLWIVIDLTDLRARWALVGVVAVVAASVLGFVVGNVVYDSLWGPTHPASAAAELPDSDIDWVWSGAVTTDRAEVRAMPSSEFDSVRLAVATDPSFADPVWFDPVDAVGVVVGFVVDELDPATEYHYAVEVDGRRDDVRSGTFTTFPEGPASFTVAVGACARVGSNGAVFDAIRELDPDLYLIAGDFHYGDNGVNDLERFREVLDLTLTRPGQAALYRQLPIAYVWDDHDYGPNDADGNSSSREAAMKAYREYVPSYDLAGPESPVYQAFTIGRVRFVVTDARSGRNVDFDDELGVESMLGLEQKAWFKEEVVEASESHELVVWVNPVPWVAEERDGADHWAGFAEERRELADHIADNGVDNLLMVSGDAHMVAIDDGTNTDYSTDQVGGFPLLHSAALDRPGSEKGGPYSIGAMGGSGQFATIEVTDDGDAITVDLVARTWDGEEPLSYEFSTSGGTGPAGQE